MIYSHNGRTYNSRGSPAFVRMLRPKAEYCVYLVFSRFPEYNLKQTALDFQTTTKNNRHLRYIF